MTIYPSLNVFIMVRSYLVMYEQLQARLDLQQEIIDYTGMEAFAKEPKFGKVLRELTSWCYLKIHWFLSFVCNSKFAAFECFAAG